MSATGSDRYRLCQCQQAQARQDLAAAAQQGDRLRRRSGLARLHQIYLHGQPDELLHLLHDQPFRRVGADLAASPVPVSGAVAAGSIIGGPIGDKIGARKVIWASILGVLPFTLALPYANLEMTAVLTIIIGLILASAFPAIIVFAQELLPGRVGMVSGLFFGFAFGMARHRRRRSRYRG